MILKEWKVSGCQILCMGLSLNVVDTSDLTIPRRKGPGIRLMACEKQGAGCDGLLMVMPMDWHTGQKITARGPQDCTEEIFNDNY